MIIAIVAGTILGFVLAMPPGPIGVLAMKYGLYKGLKPAVYVSIGSGVADFFFCLIAASAASAATLALADFSDKHPIYTFLLQIIVIVAFIIYGIINLKKKEKCVENLESVEIESKSKFVKQLKNKGPFFLGIGFALTNMASPAFLPSLGYVSMQVQKLNIFPITFSNTLLYSLGFGFGNFLWLYLLSTTVHKLKDRFSGNFLLRVRQFAGITFIAFGGILGWRLLFFTKWTELFKIAMALI